MCKQKCKKKIIIIKHENVNIKWTKQGYGTNLKLMLIRLNVKGVLSLFIPLWKPNSWKFLCKFPYAHRPKNS
jgi:hypothetical protein